MKKTVLITGSSRGIGLSAAKRFAKEKNWNIVMTCQHSRDALHEQAEKLRKEGCTVLESVGDISDPTYVQALFAQIEEKFSTLNVLINNAGIDYFGLLQDMDVEAWDRIMNVNLKSVFLCTKYAIPLMLRQQEGSIVNISSVWGNIGGSCEAAYSASKGGINAFSKAMAQELAPSHIRVNALAFGAIDTSMNARLSDEEKGALCDEIPLCRMGTPAEAADLIYGTAVTYTYLTGQVITLDGGWT